MKRIKHLITLLFLASLSIPTPAQYVTDSMDFNTDSIAIDSIEDDDIDSTVYLDSLRLLVETNPQDGNAWLDLADAYWITNADTALFEQALLKCISLLPESQPDDLERAGWLAKFGLSGNKRMDLLKMTLQRLPLNITIKDYLAQAYYEEDDYDMAEHYDSIAYDYMLAHPSEDFLDALHNAAERVTSKEASMKISTEMRYYRSWQRYKLAYDIYPDNRTQMLLAFSYIRLAPYGNKVYASENESRKKAGLMPIDFEQALVDSALTIFETNDVDDYYYIAKLLFGQWEEIDSNTVKTIENCILRKIEAKPKEALWPFLEGMLLQYTKKPTQASSYLAMAYSLEPNGNIAAEAVYCYYLSHQWEKAEEYVKKALRHELPHSWDAIYAHAILCNIYSAQGNYAAAIKAIEKGIKNYDEYNQLGIYLFYQLRAMTYILQGQGQNARLNSKALNDLQKAYIMGEDFYDRNMIVLWYGWLLNQPHKALPSDSISRFLQANYRTLVLENDGTLSVANILAHHFWGDSAQARHEMDELLTCDPNNKYFFEIAGFYALQGDTEKATEVLRNGTKKGNYSFAALRDLPWLNSLKGVAEYESLLKQQIGVSLNSSKEQ